MQNRRQNLTYVTRRRRRRRRGKSAGLLGVLLGITIFTTVFIFITTSAKNDAEVYNPDGVIEKYIDPFTIQEEEEASIESETKRTKNVMDLTGIPEDILQLLERNPEASEFVFDYKENMPVYGRLDNDEIDISLDVTPGKVPHFLQWDKRWGYKEYNGSGSVMGISGCGPTTISMTVVYLTGDIEKHPAYMADYLYENGFSSESGTSWAAYPKAAEDFGLNMRELPADETKIKDALSSGAVVVVSVKPGIFTQTGPFILLTGLTEDGKIKLNDPNSIIRSNETWEVLDIINEARNFWAFSK